MWEEFFAGPLALHPGYLETYARRAATADAKTAAAGREAHADADPDWNLDDLEGSRFPRPVTINGVAILPLAGLLAPSLPYWERGTSTELFAMQFLAALDDPQVKQIVLRINSPGGLLSGTAETADLIYRNRDRKPITAFAVNGLMASAAFFIGSAAGKVYATRSTEIGSVGVIWAHYDLTKMAADAGVKVSLVSIPEDKAIGYDQRPLSDSDRAKLVATWLQPAYDQFVGALARNRGVSADTVTSEYGRGLTYMAEEAAQRGMIDGVRDWNEFLREITNGAAIGAGESSLTNQALGSLGGRESPTSLLGEGIAMKFSAKLKAIMLTAGILESLDVEDAACAMALRVWCTAKGVSVPTEEDAACKLIRKAIVSEEQGGNQPGLAAVAAPLQLAPPPAAQPVDVQAEVQRALAAEHTRQAAIRTRATMLSEQLGMEVPDADLQTALSNTQVTAERFSESLLASAQGANRPVGRVEGGPASLDKFTAAAAAAMLMRTGPDLARMAVASGASQERAQAEAANLQANVQRPAAHTGADAGMVRSISRMSFLQIAQESVRLSGHRVRDNSDESWATAFLKLAGDDRQNAFAVGHPGIEGGLMASTPIHGAGSFPNLMGMVAQQTSYFAINVAPVSYWRWATRHDDALNFNPQEILQFYGSTRLDEHVDTKPPGQATFSEQAAWLAVNQYSKGAKLSARMVIQNQLTTFLRMLVQFQIAVERTVNELVVNHLIDNTACPFDNVALFNLASHANDRTSGNAPSITENKAMRLLLAQQAIPGDTVEAGLTFDFALYGSENINAAELQYLPAYRVVPGSQTDVNQFTGRVEPIYEPLLSVGDPVWYAGSRSPLVVGILYSFLQGSGPGGRRVTYFDPATQCQSFDYYVEAGSALVNYQPYARNAGTGAT
jgi:signal peptide peptidase SppA